MKPSSAVAAHQLVTLVHCLEQHCDDGRKWLQRRGLDDVQLSGAPVVSRAGYQRLYNQIAGRLQQQFFALSPGRRLPPGAFEMLARPLIYAPSLAEAVQRCGDFFAICRDVELRPRLRLQGRIAVIDAVDIASEKRVATLSGATLSLWHLFFSWLIGERIELLNGDSTPTAEFRFDRRWLARAPTRDETALAQFIEAAHHHLLLVAEGGHGVISAQVRVQLAGSSPAALPSAEAMASLLAMSVKTLDRRLQQEGTSYQRLKDGHRFQLAKRLLQNPELTVQSIAEQLGCADASSFYRMFKRWTGVTPSVYRQKADSRLSAN